MLVLKIIGRKPSHRRWLLLFSLLGCLGQANPALAWGHGKGDDR